MEDFDNVVDFAIYRLEKAKETLKTAEILLDEVKDYSGANNRAYYAIFYAIRAVLAIEKVDFKRHKDVVAYFNKNYISTEIFPKIIGKKIAQAKQIREDCDYDDNYVPSYDKTKIQVETARELIQLVDKYLQDK